MAITENLYFMAGINKVKDILAFILISDRRFHTESYSSDFEEDFHSFPRGFKGSNARAL